MEAPDEAPCEGCDKCVVDPRYHVKRAMNTRAVVKCRKEKSNTEVKIKTRVIQLREENLTLERSTNAKKEQLEHIMRYFVAHAEADPAFVLDPEIQVMDYMYNILDFQELFPGDDILKLMHGNK